MFELLRGIFFESVELFVQMSPYLLLGFFFAGLLHVYISVDFIARHLGKSSFGSVIKSVLLGIPLPLCSCGVIPAAIALRKKGVSRGSVVSFLIATPITGVDSIFATYSLLGFVFTIFRLIAAALTAIVAGVLTNLFDLHSKEDHAKEERHECCHESSHGSDESVKLGGFAKIKEMLHYAFVQLLGDIWKWLVLGLLIAGVISYSIPETFIQQYLGSSWQSMLIMLAIGIPMYVCSTGSIPIAASLMLKGMSPGAALVFLLAGPATNAVTITVVAKEIGKRATVLYVLTIAVMSIFLGMFLNLIWDQVGVTMPELLHHHAMIPAWVEVSTAILLAGLIGINLVKKILR